MSLFAGPAEHAANPPETWQVVKSGRAWHLTTKTGVVLDYFVRKSDAVEAIESGTMRRLYDDETRWYAGESVRGWKPWAGEEEREVMKRGPVCLDELVTVEAVYVPRDRWNGFLCPRMDRDAVEVVMAAFRQYDGETDPRPPTHRWDGDVLTVTEYDGDDEYHETLEPDADGLYALGARSWVWTEDEDR